MKRPLRFLASTRLAVILIAYLALASALSTFLKLDGFFSSPFFLAPAILFIANLSACSVSRIVREVRKKKGARRHGPDLLHAGLLVLAIGALFSLAMRREAYAELSPGDVAILSESTRIRLESFDSPLYPDGRPRDFVSRVTILHGSLESGQSREIRVNRPLVVDGVSIYQASRGKVLSLDLSGPGSAAARLLQGSPSSLGELEMTLKGRDEATGRAIVETAGASGKRTFLAAPGDAIGAFTAGGLSEVTVSGLKAVSDPGWIPSLAGLLIALSGTALTLFQKFKEERP